MIIDLFQDEWSVRHDPSCRVCENSSHLFDFVNPETLTVNGTFDSDFHESLKLMASAFRSIECRVRTVVKVFMNEGTLCNWKMFLKSINTGLLPYPDFDDISDEDKERGLMGRIWTAGIYRNDYLAYGKFCCSTK